MDISTRDVSTMFKAFCDENRIRILQMLVSGEKCACSLLEELNVTQPTLSHHMKILCDAGIVAGRKDGKWMHYSIDHAGVEQCRTYLDRLIHVAPDEDQKEGSCCK